MMKWLSKCGTCEDVQTTSLNGYDGDGVFCTEVDPEEQEFEPATDLSRQRIGDHSIDEQVYQCTECESEYLWRQVR